MKLAVSSPRIFGRLAEQTFIILAGHGRGGLAARAYLQQAFEPPSRPPFRVGLVTVGTPHLGSPFGRIRSWLLAYGKRLSDETCLWLPESKLRFAFAPSTGYLATAHDPSKAPSPSAPISKAIRDLNAQAPRLTGLVDVFGEMRSNMIPFGVDIGELPFAGREAVLDASTLIGCITKDDAEKQSALDYIQLNLPDAWLNEGDGIVPFVSQQVLKVPGVRGNLWYIDLKIRTAHVNETSRTGSIKAIVDKVSAELGALPPVVVTSSLPPEFSLRSGDAPPIARKEEIKPVADLEARLPARHLAVLREARAALLRKDSDRLFALGQQTLALSDSASSDASVLALRLLRLAGSEKAVRLAFESLTAERGWTQDSVQSIAAEYSLLPFKVTGEALSDSLRRAAPDSPAAAAASAAVLARSGEPATVGTLIQWARTLSGPDAAERAARAFRQIASTAAIGEFRKSLSAMPPSDESVLRVLKTVLAEIDLEPQKNESSR